MSKNSVAFEGARLSTGTYASRSLLNLRVTLNRSIVPATRVKGFCTLEKMGCIAMLRLTRRPSTQAKMYAGDRILRIRMNGIEAEFVME